MFQKMRDYSKKNTNGKATNTTNNGSNNWMRG